MRIYVDIQDDDIMSYDLRLVSPEFGSDLTTTIIKLDHLRKRTLKGTAAPWYFFQLKHIFHWLESLGSARIEGNHTTIADYVEHQIEGEDDGTESLREIKNISEAIKYVEDNIAKGSEITARFIFDLHSIIVKDLTREGDKNAGAYRIGEVTITDSKHVPPDHLHVRDLMNELLDFIKKDDIEQYDLVKIALFHHRFTWIHPFGNGNGRVVRMLNYALLIKYGFNVKEGRILNPSCVFFSDRDLYYSSLSVADRGTDDALLRWCRYVLMGGLDEIIKIDALLDRKFLLEKILKPAIDNAVNRKAITPDEADILRLGLNTKTQSFKASDISDKYTPRQKTYALKKLKEAGFIKPVKENSHTYYVNFSRSFLLRGVMNTLEEKEFIPPMESHVKKN